MIVARSPGMDKCFLYSCLGNRHERILSFRARFRHGMQANIPFSRLHHLANSSNDQAIENLCLELNETKTLFPGTQLQMIFEFGVNL